ncbi:protein of unknown function [Paenibacillus sp. yr247]|uniref:DUF4160 domain-containing protein n=1 Tax=Paenibacillus sp. yr247 TaxID=1761880 RepID=UPI000888A2E1|nr:DUF4160 domain-containing protein [Paenibacillus sp. yr247]SDO14903.1 protein of unknown function [Paenibacillus sp. yr247]
MELLEVIVDDLFNRLNGTKRQRLKIARKKANPSISLIMKTEFRPTKRVVGRVKNMIFEIYTNDHNPPHFHVTADRYEAKFRIENPILIGGKIPIHSQTVILRWARENQDYLIRVWHECRPRIIEKSS